MKNKPPNVVAQTKTENMEKNQTPAPVKTQDIYDFTNEMNAAFFSYLSERARIIAKYKHLKPDEKEPTQPLDFLFVPKEILPRTASLAPNGRMRWKSSNERIIVHSDNYSGGKTENTNG